MKKTELAVRLTNACTCVSEAEDILTEIDSKFGDADHGLTMTKIAKAISQAVAEADGGIQSMLDAAAMAVMMLNGGSAVPLWNTFDVLVHIPGGWEQVGAVAQGGHIGGIQGKLFLAHHIDRHMGEVEVLQRDGADIPGVRNFHLILIALAVRPCLCPIAGLRGHGFGEDVDRKSTRLNSSHIPLSRMPSSA